MALIEQYLLDDNAGSTTVAGANGNNGTSARNTNLISVVGKINRAFDLNGSSDQVNCGNPAAFQMTGSMTLAVWINPDNTANSANQRQIIFKIGDSSHRGYDLYYVKNTQQVLVFRIAQNSTTQITHSANIGSIVSAWHHVAGVYNAASQTMELFLDGVSIGLKNTGVPSSQYSANGVNLLLGNGFGFFSGLLDDVRIYDEALTPGQIRALYVSGGGTAIYALANVGNGILLAGIASNGKILRLSGYTDTEIVPADNNRDFLTIQLQSAQSGVYLNFGDTATINNYIYVLTKGEPITVKGPLARKSVRAIGITSNGVYQSGDLRMNITGA